MTEFEKVGKLRDLFLKIKIILKKMMHFDQTNIISQQITKRKKCIETTSFWCIDE
jgi:acyl-ACP thioesterase